MRIRSFILVLMVLYDFSLHVVKVLDIVSSHPFYPIFPLLGLIPYDIFWSIFWGIGLLLALSILFSERKSIKIENYIELPQNKINVLENIPGQFLKKDQKPLGKYPVVNEEQQ